MTKTSGRVPVVNNFATGEIRYRGFRLDGTMHGYWQFFRKDGSVMRTGEFDRGGRVGVWRTFDRAGRLLRETTYVGGIAVKATASRPPSRGKKTR